MALENLKPDILAQELTNPHYMALTQQGWPENLVQQGSNTIYQYTTLCGQLLMQEPGLDIPSEVEGQPARQIPMTDELGRQIMDLFAETVSQAYSFCLEKGLPEAARNKILETLAEDIYSYSKQVVSSIQDANPTPERASLTTWLTQTAQEAVNYYLAEYEKEFGVITPEVVQRQPIVTAPPASLSEIVATPVAPTIPSPVESATPPPAVSAKAPTPASSSRPLQAQGGGQLKDKISAIAMLLKSLPKTQHERVLNLFPLSFRDDILSLVDRDDWLQEVDPVQLSQQLEGLKRILQQPVTQPEYLLKGLLSSVPWQDVQSVLMMERPGWLNYLMSLRDGEPIEQPLSQALQTVLYHYLDRQFRSADNPDTLAMAESHHGDY